MSFSEPAAIARVSSGPKTMTGSVIPARRSCSASSINATAIIATRSGSQTRASSTAPWAYAFAFSTAISRARSGNRRKIASMLREKTAVSTSAHVGRKRSPDIEILSIHRPRFRGREEADRLRDLLGRHRRRRAAADVRPHRSIYGAGADAVHAHARVAHFDRQ